jgi:NADH-quinone oxidoreductase subunit H
MSWLMTTYQFILTMITILVVLGGIMGACTYLIYIERKIAAYMQDRIGPNRVGPKGLFQPIADALKFLFKEDIIPTQVDKVLFLAAPAIALSTALLAFAIVPFGPTAPPPVPPQPPAATASPAEKAAYQHDKADYDRAWADYENHYQFAIAPRIDIGIVFVFAVTSLAVYAIILGGWSSNSKYSFIGGLRSSAQLVSYEIPMGMSVLGVVLLTGSLNLERIIDHQIDGGWNIWFQPVGFLLFLTAAFAECNRLPFDLPEAEQELVGGYHTEYSAVKFALFFAGEYAHMITTSFLLSILFFGGWHFPWIAARDSYAVVKVLVILLKVSAFILFFMLIRWTIPRFRFDQLMGLAWKVLIPLALANLLCVMVVKQMIASFGLSPGWLWVLLPVSLLLFVGAAVPAVLWSSRGRPVMVTASGNERVAAVAR